MLPRRTDVPRWNGTSGRLGAWNPTGCSTSTRRRRRPRRSSRHPPRRRWPYGCGRARWTRWSGRRTCCARARRCAGSSRAARRRRCCSTGRPAPGRPRSRACWPGWGARHFVALSALSSGVRELRQVIEDARRRRDLQQPPDRAVHRRGPPLLQDPAGRAAGRGRGPRSCCWSPRPPRTRRSRWCRRCCRARWCCGCESLTDDDVRALLRRAVADERGLAGAVTVAPDAEAALVRLAAGDARRALTALEAAADGVAGDRGRPTIDVPPSSGPSPRRPCATTGRATSTTT